MGGVSYRDILMKAKTNILSLSHIPATQRQTTLSAQYVIYVQPNTLGKNPALFIYKQSKGGAKTLTRV